MIQKKAQNSQETPKSHYPIIPLESGEFGKFLLLLEQINKNLQVLNGIGACITCWQLCPGKELKLHSECQHKTLPPSSFYSKDLFLNLCSENGKINEEKSLVCLFDNSLVKNQLEKLKEVIFQEKSNKIQNAVETKPAKKKPEDTESMRKRDVKAFRKEKPKERCVIQYNQESKKDLEIEYFKGKVCSMVDDIYKKYVSLENRLSTTEHKIDMLIHKLDHQMPDLNVLPLLSKDSQTNIFPKMYSSKEAEFFTFLKDLYFQNKQAKRRRGNGGEFQVNRNLDNRRQLSQNQITNTPDIPAKPETINIDSDDNDEFMEDKIEDSQSCDQSSQHNANVLKQQTLEKEKQNFENKKQDNEIEIVEECVNYSSDKSASEIQVDEQDMINVQQEPKTKLKQSEKVVEPEVPCNQSQTNFQEKSPESKTVPQETNPEITSMTPNNDNQNISLSPPEPVPVPTASKPPTPSQSSIPIVPSAIPQEAAIQPISPIVESPANFTPSDPIPIPIPSMLKDLTNPSSGSNSPTPAVPPQSQPQLEPNQQEVQEPIQLQSEQIKDPNPQNTENIINVDEASDMNQDTTTQVDAGSVNCDVIDQPQNSHQDHSSNSLN